MKMEATNFFETSVTDYRQRRRHAPKD